MKTISKFFALALLGVSMQIQSEPISYTRDNDLPEERIQHREENKQLELVKKQDPIIQAMAPIAQAGSKLTDLSWKMWIAGILLRLSGTDRVLYDMSYPICGIGCGASAIASGISGLRSESLSKTPSIFVSGLFLVSTVFGAQMAKRNITIPLSLMEKALSSRVISTLGTFGADLEL